MSSRFIARTQRLAAKILANNAMRIYINNAGALRTGGFHANAKISIKTLANRIEITLNEQGDNKVFDTGRGELIELKNLKTRQAMGDINFVTVTFRLGKIIITAHAVEQRAAARVGRLKRKLKTRSPLISASLFSGLGMLSYHIKQGLQQGGIASSIYLANDIDPLAMSLNVDHNPMWQHATADAQAVTDEIQALAMMPLSEVDWVDISYPCVGFSSLAEDDRKDTAHPACGVLFISLIAVLRKLNPAVMVFENVPGFARSATLSMIKSALPDYQFSERIMSGHSFGELEDRKRIAIIATSTGMPAFDMEQIVPSSHPRRCFGDVLTPIPADSPLFREMPHVRRRDDMPTLGYRNCLYGPEATAITTATASYASPKAGAPMVRHPTDPLKQRQITVEEHANLRDLPPALHQAVCEVESGKNPMVSTRGSKEAGHRLCGNGVSKWIWQSTGRALSDFLKQWALGPEAGKQLSLAI